MKKNKDIEIIIFVIIFVFVIIYYVIIGDPAIFPKYLSETVKLEALKKEDCNRNFERTSKDFPEEDSPEVFFFQFKIHLFIIALDPVTLEAFIIDVRKCLAIFGTKLAE